MVWRLFSAERIGGPRSTPFLGLSVPSTVA